jgi:excinuclease UvrABC nuclease subunit
MKLNILNDFPAIMEFISEEFFSSRDWKELSVINIEEDKSYIYFFMSKDEEILYIGQTCNIHARIGSHISRKVIPGIEKVKYFQVESCQADDIEASLIVKYDPPYNFNIPVNNRFMSLEVFKNKFGHKGKSLKIRKYLKLLRIKEFNGYYDVYDLTKVHEAIVRDEV